MGKFIVMGSHSPIKKERQIQSFGEADCIWRSISLLYHVLKIM
nr:MAG TPA: hypothetical protein [Caudoviricetes sp.]